MMWYWYVIGVIAFLIGFLSYSLLVAAGRADVKREAIEREELSKSLACGFTPSTQSWFDENSGEKVSALTSTPPTQSTQTNIKHPSP